MEYATALFSAASSLTQRGFASNYTLHSSQQSSSSSNEHAHSVVHVGVWRVERATHNGPARKQVSIWTCDKQQLVTHNSRASISSSSSARAQDLTTKRLERAITVLKKEATSLSRLRHPCVLEMTEPVEETRSTISFATEPVTACLRHSISTTGRSNKQRDDLELDEVEIQKGLSQIGKGLQFLHESVKLVHGNLTPDSIVINDKGDWKLAGFGLSTYLFESNGVAAKWEFPEYDHSLPSFVQRDYDFIAPEYILDESPPSPSNDMYSLGCLIHMIHLKQGPPFSNHNSLEQARRNMDEALSRNLLRTQWRRLPDEVQSVLSSLLTRYPNSRITSNQFLTHQYFSNLLVSTLNFLSRDTFNSQSIETQTNFLQGLLQILPKFSDKVNKRKVLPCLIEETRKLNLIPFLLPNILFISNTMSNQDFQQQVLMNLKPLFGLRDPPQAVVSLLDSISVFVDKCSPVVFREEVMPLIYSALEGDNPIVLEKALKVVPQLSETLDYTTVKTILFPKVATVFSKTTLLSVKVNTLICFHSMIKTLDKYTLTEKLVPLLSKIKTKEPAVMIATLAVHEAMGNKVEVSAIATLILPQLWAMSIGPLLNVHQFEKFMNVIRKLSARVEEEHMKHLKELKRLEDSNSNNTTVNGGVRQNDGSIDFETLVRGGGGIGSIANGTAKEVQNDLWADDSPRSLTPAFSTPVTPALSPSINSSFSPSLNTAPLAPAHSARPSVASTGSYTGHASPPLSTAALSSVSASVQPSYPSSFPITSRQTPTPSINNFATLQPTTNKTINLNRQSSHSVNYSAGRPNYDLNGSMSTIPLSSKPQWNVVTPQQQKSSIQPAITPSSVTSTRTTATTNSIVAPPGYNAGVLEPKIVAPKKPVTTDFSAWADFDPLK
ncbi:Protein kinase domain-containing protein ppk32 [Microbotryomycetes sp. JL221]|nr:Protein kinase domain-containing protein ppk32 [Microbotryomycetes sp. JL221]